MAVSADHVLYLTAGLFGLAPSRAITNDLTNAANVSVLAAQLGNAQFTKDFYPVFNDAKAAKLADILLGTSVSAETKTAATGALQGMLDANGGNVGSAALGAIEFLLSTSDTNFAAAKTQLQNRVEVAKAYVNSKNPVTNLDVTTVTQEAATKDAALAKIDAPVAQSLNLGTGIDNLIGTSGNDTFTARIFDNSNSLQSGDKVDGGAGTDTLIADVGNSQRFAITAETANVENVVIRAQAVSSDSTDNNTSITNEVQIDAERMNGVNYWENSNSRADLLIEDVRILPTQITKDITIAMVETDPGHVDFGFYFDQYSLRAQKNSSSQLTIELADTRSLAAGGAALKDNPYWGFKFLLGGVEQTVTSDAIDAAQTYAELLTAVNAALAANPALTGVTAALGTPVTRTDTISGQAVQVTPLILSNSGAASLSTVASGDAWLAKNGVPASSGLHTFMTTASAVSTDKVTSKVILDDVGRGSTGGDLVIGGLSVGDTSTSKGVQRFEIEVRDNSKLQTINSTNNTLEEVIIKNGATSNHDGYAYVATVKDKGNLTVNGQLSTGNNTSGTPSTNIDNALPGTETANGGDQHNAFGFSDVRLIDGTQMTGKLAFTAEITDKSIAKYLNLTDTQDAPATDNVAFVYSGGANDDTMSVVIDAAVAGSTASMTGREDFTFAFNGGAGNDTITTDIGDNETGAWYVNQKLFANITVDGGEGNDTIWTKGAGDVRINAGAGDDAVYADNSGNVNAKWVVAAANTDLANLQASVTNTGSSFLYKGRLTVTFSGPQVADGGVTSGDAAALANGWEVTVDIPTGTNYAVNQLHINQAIKKAINEDSVMNKLLSVVDGPANTLVISSKIDGQFDEDDIRISVSAPDVTTLTTSEQGIVLNAYKAFANNSTANITAAQTAQAASVTNKNLVNGMDLAQSLASNGTQSAAESDNTIDLGAGNDVVVLGTGAASNDTLVFNGYDLGKKTIVNFTQPGTGVLDGDYINFNSYLTSQSSASGSADSTIRIANTFNTDNTVEANSITVLNGVFTADQGFAGLTAAKLLAAVNSANTGAANYAGLTAGTLDAVNNYSTTAPVGLVGGSGKAVVLVQNNLNAGEYKAFELTFDGTATNTTRDFSGAKEIAVLDFGNSLTGGAGAGWSAAVTSSAPTTPGGAGTTPTNPTNPTRVETALTDGANLDAGSGAFEYNIVLGASDILAATVNNFSGDDAFDVDNAYINAANLFFATTGTNQINMAVGDLTDFTPTMTVNINVADAALVAQVAAATSSTQVIGILNTAWGTDWLV